MESTGKYWIPIFNVLELSCRVIDANPKYVRNIPGKKTDKKDSIWLADLHKYGLVKGSFIPPKAKRELRDILRYRFKLVNASTSEKNRFQNSLTVSNIMLSNVVSDTFGKSASEIIRFMIDNPETTNFDYTSMLRKSLKKKSEDIGKAITGSLSKEQATKLSICLDHFESIHKCIDVMDAFILELSSSFKSQIDIVDTLPGVTEKSATAIISEIGIDMTVFGSAKHLCSWAGLTPQSNESAGKKKSVKISRAGVFIKPLLVQCANAAIKDKSCPYFKHRYDSIKSRRGHKRAIIAIARMLLTCIYNMLSRNEAFNPSLYEDRSPKRKREGFSNVDDAIAFLLANGYSVVSSDQEVATT